MTVGKKESSGLINLGSGRTSANDKSFFLNLFKAILTTNTFSFSTVAYANTKAQWEAGIKAQTVFPLPPLAEVEQADVDEKYATSADGTYDRRTVAAVRKWNLYFDVPDDVRAALMSYDGFTGKVFLVDGQGYFRANVVSGVTSGLSCKVSVAGEKSAPQDGSKVSQVKMLLTLTNYFNEWDSESGVGKTMKPSWSLSDLVPLCPVYIEQVGTATATAVKLRVYSDGGYDDTGAVVKTPITGLVKADFVWTTSAGADQTSAVTGTCTDNEDGTYDFVCTGMADGTVNLVTTPNLSGGFFNSHFGTSDGEAALDIT